MQIFEDPNRPERLIPRIDDKGIDIHKPSLLQRIFYKYGYVEAPQKPICRKNVMNGLIEVRYYLEAHREWAWMEVADQYKDSFIEFDFWKR